MNNNTYPNPWDLRYFQEVAKTENLSRAAERLGVGQPALSLSVKRLETMLQVDLFQRGNRGLTLTEAGVRLLKECDQLMESWNSVVSETRKSETELSGLFRLGCHPAIAIYALTPLMKNLYKTYPAIEVRLIHGLSRIITEGVISGQIDFGIVANPIRHPDLVITPMARDEVYFWRAAHADADVLLYNPALVQAQTMLKKFKKKVFKRTVTSESLEVLATLAKAGVGYAILPERVANALAPELKKVPGTPSFADEITFVYRHDIRKTAGAKALMGCLREIRI